MVQEGEAARTAEKVQLQAEDMDLKSENGKLQTENLQLRARLNDMEEQAAAKCNAQDEEGEMLAAVFRVISASVKKAPQLKDMLMSALAL